MKMQNEQAKLQLEAEHSDAFHGSLKHKQEIKEIDFSAHEALPYLWARGFFPPHVKLKVPLDKSHKNIILIHKGSWSSYRIGFTGVQFSVIHIYILYPKHDWEGKLFSSIYYNNRVHDLRHSCLIHFHYIIKPRSRIILSLFCGQYYYSETSDCE